MSVREMLARMDSAELTEWRAYYELEPFGELIADQRHGIATSVLANVNRDAKRRPDPYQPEDFIYWHQKHREADRAQFVDNPTQQAALVTRALFRKVKRPTKR